MSRFRSYYSEQRNKEAAAARRRAAKKPDLRPLPPENDPQAKAAYEAGGLLIRVELKIPEGLNGGCGTPTHVVGTNGGKMPCGSLLSAFGKTEPYYCGHCQERMKGERL